VKSLRLASLLVLIVASAAFAGRANHERYYQEKWCSAVGGETEVRLEDGTRADCVARGYAIEFDFADKWAEAVGQSIHYAEMLGLRPGIVLIIEDPIRDQKYVERLVSTLEAVCVKRGDTCDSVDLWVMFK